MDEENPINYLLLMLDEGDIFIQSCGAIKYQPISELKEIQSSKFKFVIAGTHNLIRFNREEVLSNNIGLTHLEPPVQDAGGHRTADPCAGLSGHPVPG